MRAEPRTRLALLARVGLQQEGVGAHLEGVPARLLEIADPAVEPHDHGQVEILLLHLRQRPLVEVGIHRGYRKQCQPAPRVAVDHHRLATEHDVVGGQRGDVVALADRFAVEQFDEEQLDLAALYDPEGVGLGQQHRVVAADHDRLALELLDKLEVDAAVVAVHVRLTN